MTSPFAHLAVATLIFASASAPAFARDANERRAPGSTDAAARIVVAISTPTSVEMPSGLSGRNCDRRARGSR